VDRAVSVRSRGRARGAKAGRRGLSAFTPGLSALALLAFAAGCVVDERRSGLPPGAQAALDELTADVAAGRFDEVYADAAAEWREAVSADESRAILARVRDRLGRVQSRAPVRASEQGEEGAAGHSLSVAYNTRFERGDAVEFVTLVERDGRWRLARYSVNSEALKP
jgi:hypothetical protein